MLENKNIAILITSLAGGGGEREAAILANQFSKNNKVHILLLNDTIAYEIDERVQIHYLDHLPLVSKSIQKMVKIPKLASKYRSFCDDNSIDISISIITRTNLVASLAKKKGNKPRTLLLEVISLNSAYPPGGGLVARVMRSLIRRYYRYADLLIPNSKGSEKELRDDFGFTHTHTIYNPLEIDRIRQAGQLEPRVMPSSDKFTFVMVARFHAQKDFRTLLYAFSQMKNNEKELILVGEGEDKEDMIALAEELGIADDVKFVGFDRNPFSYLSRSDCFVFSTFFEGFPNSMQEAMAFGLPLISSDCHNGPREMIDPALPVDREIFDEKMVYEGQCGYLVPVADSQAMAEAMDRMMEDDEKRKQFGKRSEEIAENFRVDKIVEEFSKYMTAE